jgi:hypothetical protein
VWGSVPLPSGGPFHTTATVTSFPNSKVAGQGRHSCFLWLIYLQFMWGCAPSPLWWRLPHDSHYYKLSLLQGCWVGSPTSAFSGQLVYLQFA